MTLEQFYAQVYLRHKYQPTRIGQTLFNTLYDIRPDISETVRATPNDPFFSDSVHDPRYMAAVKVIEMMWDEE